MNGAEQPISPATPEKKLGKPGPKTEQARRSVGNATRLRWERIKNALLLLDQVEAQKGQS